MKLSKYLAAALLLISPATFAGPPGSAKDKDKDEVNRIENAGMVMDEILNVPDDLPQDLLDKARCVIVLPSVLKAAFVVGGSYGRGVLVCRTGERFGGAWGAPAMYALEGGSIGFQIGGEATDFVILVMNNRGAQSLLQARNQLVSGLRRRKFRLGDDLRSGSVASVQLAVAVTVRTKRRAF